MRNRKLAVVVTMLVVGCAGGESSKKQTVPAADVARTAGGEAIMTADGSAVSKKAHNRWESALQRFGGNEETGWTQAKCGASSKDFEKAAAAQGGGFAEAHYMAGLSLERCGDTGADKHYETALKVDPKFCRARVAQDYY